MWTKLVHRYAESPVPWDHGRGNIQLRARTRLLFVSKGIDCFGKSISYAAGKRLQKSDYFIMNLIENDLGHALDWLPKDQALCLSDGMRAKETDTLPEVFEFLKVNHLPWGETKHEPRH